MALVQRRRSPCPRLQLRLLGLALLLLLAYLSCCVASADSVDEAPRSRGSAVRPQRWDRSAHSDRSGAHRRPFTTMQTGAARTLALAPLRSLSDPPADLRYIAVDPLEGDDSACLSVDALAAGAAAALVPCRTVTRAVALVAAPGAWLQLLPGAEHRGGDLRLNYSSISFSSLPPPTLSEADVAAAANGIVQLRMDAAAGELPTWSCAGFTNCLLSNSTELQLLDLIVTGAAQHAVVHGSGSGPAADPFPSVRFFGCIFKQIGGVLLKSGGEAELNGCLLTQAVSHAAVVGLLQLSDSDLLVTDSRFERNELFSAVPPMRSCIVARSYGRHSAVRIEWSIFDSNSMLLTDRPGGRSDTGGGAVRIAAADVSLSITHSTFRDQKLTGDLVYGGAVLLLSETEANFGGERSINVTIDDCVFERCRVDRFRPPALVSSSQIEARSAARRDACAALGCSRISCCSALTSSSLFLSVRVADGGGGAVSLMQMERSIRFASVVAPAVSITNSHFSNCFASEWSLAGFGHRSQSACLRACLPLWLTSFVRVRVCLWVCLFSF
jgi:hypothetical protein